MNVKYYAVTSSDITAISINGNHYEVNKNGQFLIPEIDFHDVLKLGLTYVGQVDETEENVNQKKISKKKDA